MKFEELDRALLQETSEDSWYDDGCEYVQKILNDCTDEDWKTIFDVISDRKDKWKIHLAYIIDEDSKMNGFKVLLHLLLNSTNHEVVFTSLNALRSFDNEPYRELILSDKKIFEKINQLSDEDSPLEKMIIEDFLKQY